MAERANRLPKKVKSDADLSLVGTVITDARDLAKRVENTRTEEGRPLLDATKMINEHFKALGTTIAKAIAPAQEAADVYTREKAAAEKARREREAEEARKKEEAAREKAENATTAAAAARAARDVERHAHAAEAAEQAASASTADVVRTRSGGVTATGRTFWNYQITDYPAVQATLGPLGHFLPRADVEKAIRSLVRIQKGGASLPGVKVYEDTKSSFRK